MCARARAQCKQKMIAVKQSIGKWQYCINLFILTPIHLHGSLINNHHQHSNEYYYDNYVCDLFRFNWIGSIDRFFGTLEHQIEHNFCCIEFVCDNIDINILWAHKKTTFKTFLHEKCVYLNDKSAESCVLATFKKQIWMLRKRTALIHRIYACWMNKTDRYWKCHSDVNINFLIVYTKKNGKQ